jgi:hypothetical protein
MRAIAFRDYVAMPMVRQFAEARSRRALALRLADTATHRGQCLQQHDLCLTGV